MCKFLIVIRTKRGFFFTEKCFKIQKKDIFWPKKCVFHQNALIFQIIMRIKQDYIWPKQSMGFAKVSEKMIQYHLSQSICFSLNARGGHHWMINFVLSLSRPFESADKKKTERALYCEQFPFLALRFCSFCHTRHLTIVELI